MIDNRTQLNLVIGNPLTHTQSPILHNKMYELLDCNAVLLAHETKNLLKTLEAIRTLSVGLTAVTMPFKADIVPHLDHPDMTVKELRVANTILCRDGQLYGYNTDVDGVAYALRQVSVRDKTVLMIGAGGASHAAAFYLKKNQARLLWLNRTEKNALEMIDIFGGTLTHSHEIASMDIDMIINTTPIGMFPEVNHSPLPDYPFKTRQIVFDMVYNPMETRLLQQAKQGGATAISGLDMFIGQGLKQIEHWLGKSIITPDRIQCVTELLQKRGKKHEETV